MPPRVAVPAAMGDDAAAMKPRALHPVLFVMPLLFAAATLALRTAGGPYWIWHVVDPSYFYLFDSLNLARLEWPGHPYHPGTPVQVFGALLFRLAHPLASPAELTALVLDDPEGHLRLLGDGLVALGALALLGLGAVALRVTGRLPLALFMQAGPFLTMIILKNAHQAKPEAMLVAVMAAYCAVTLLALRPGALEGTGKTRFALAWGVLAGFGVATKLTAAPVFVLPVFLLGGWRPLLICAAAALASFTFFILPAAGSLHKFVSLTALVLKSSGAYGGGGGFVIDPHRYPADVLKMLKRPAANLPVLISLLALGIAVRRRWRVPEAELRALAGVGLAVFVHVLAVAKQPTANYLVPSYMLLPLAIVLAWRFVAGLDLGAEAFRRRAGAVASALLMVAVAFQGVAFWRQAEEWKTKRAAALGRDDRVFDRCARIYFFPSSSPGFALHLGDWWTGSRYGKEIAARLPANRFWFEQNTMELRDALGPRDLKEVAGAYPCLMLRGAHRGPISAYLAEKLPGTPWDRACSTADETVLTWRTDCQGQPR